MTQDGPSFEYLLNSARDGCRSAFDELLRRYQPKIRQWLDLDGSRPNQRGIDGSGVAQDALVSVWLGLSNFCGTTETEFIAWCRTVLKHDLVDEVRKQETVKRGGGKATLSLDQSRSDGSPLRLGVDAGLTTPSQKMARTEELRRAVQKVPQANRDVIRLFYLDDLTHEEIAERLDLPFDDTIRRFKRGVRALSRIIAELEQNERRQEERPAGSE